MRHHFFRRAVILAAAAAVSLFVAPSASAVPVWDPPDWWEQGTAELRQRGGGTCEREVVPVGNGGSEEHRTCKHRVPAKVIQRFQPNGLLKDEICNGAVSQGHPAGDTPYYSCEILAYPGTNRRPNLHTSRCGRRGGEVVWRAQTAEQAQRYGPGSRRGTKPFKTLRACLRLSRLERRIANKCGNLLGRKYRACVKRVKAAR